MRRLDIEGRTGEPRSLVLRSFVKPFFVKHAQGLLTREADMLRLLGGDARAGGRLPWCGCPGASTVTTPRS